MIQLHDITKISNYEWEISKNFQEGMIVPVRIFATAEILQDCIKDKSLIQAINTACLPGLHKYVCVMPDVHQGYGFPIGGVAAADFHNGMISPGGIGYDINCGIRLLSSTIPLRDAQKKIDQLINTIYARCPVGIGKQGFISLKRNDFEEICLKGSQWAKKKGYATQSDVDFTEDQGCIKEADIQSISKRAMERGLFQIGSLGSGNHFIEIDVVDEVFDQKSAEAMGLYHDHLAVQIHSGSRGFGHQVCTDFVKEFQTVVHKYQINVKDRELVCAPISSDEGTRYLQAMRSAANYAFCNRQVLTHIVREIFNQTFKEKNKNNYLWLVYDLAHNIGKIETHMINHQAIKVCVHRKGATRAFGPGQKEIPEKYQKIGQPILIPGSMGTSSWIMVGTQIAMEKSFGSCCHGAGRVLSRSSAKKMIRGDELISALQQKGISIRTSSLSGLAEEAPSAYKDVDQVIEATVGAGLAKKVARLRPIAVIKG